MSSPAPLELVSAVSFIEAVPFEVNCYEVDVGVPPIFKARSNPSVPRWDRSPDFLLGIFDSDVLERMPVTGISNGATDYLDQVKEEDFRDAMGNPVSSIKGIDGFQRHFVSLKIKTVDVADGTAHDFIYTLFRRYTPDNSIWVLCKSHYSKSRDMNLVQSLLDFDTIVTPSLQRRLAELSRAPDGMILPYKLYDWKTDSKVSGECKVTIMSSE
jgi:hypothetical protein